ncbi:MAG: polyphosphate polymerase domain-containing protein [Bacteroidia bacterium]|nr:polyphosphate polymerase domain-containing protein [Bacteroidia bacterium]
MNLRHERKYRLENHTYEVVRNIIESHPLGFSELFPDRQVNNIYLDTPDLAFFTENLDGVGDRRKYRLRWYGEELDPARNLILEIKAKHNELGFKIQNSIAEDLKMGNLDEMRAWIRRNVQSTLPLGPVLLNTYQRSYLQSFCGRFRVTIDRKLRFHSMEFSPRVPDFFPEDPAIVLEVKYDDKWDESWKEFSRGLPFRVGKNSKYVMGVLMTVV